MKYLELHQFARLFLMEPDEDALKALRADPRNGDALPDNLQDARVEFTRLFTMSVYPYASIFLDYPAALDGDSTARAEQFYERTGFQVRDEWMLGASDALGAELECLAYLLEQGNEPLGQEFLNDHLLTWAPVCCSAIERNANSDLYRILARSTRDLLFEMADQSPKPIKWDLWQPGLDPEDLDLYSVLDYLTTPSRCGLFISKQEVLAIGQQLEIPIGFGDRGLMMSSLLKGAGAEDRVVEVLNEFRQFVGMWNEYYEDWIERHPFGAAMWGHWLERSRATGALLEEMQSAAREAS